MYPTTFIAVVLGFWSLFHLSHTFLLKTPYFGHRLEIFILSNNISISYFHIRWVTSRWNRIFTKLSTSWSSRLKLWFDLGVAFAAIAMVAGTITLLHTLRTSIHIIFFKPQALVPEKPVGLFSFGIFHFKYSNFKQVLSVIVPGVNLPIQDAAYLLPCIFISAVLHELGHAVAATREGVQVNWFGIFTFIIYPGAFVDLNSDDMNKRDASSKLRVYCAGVWHNFIICIGVSILLLSFPILVQPFYSSSTSTNTPLSGTMGFHVGDKINKIDFCKVSNASDWYNCIEKARDSPQWGSCMPLAEIKKQTSHTSFTSRNGLESQKHSWRDCCSPQAPSTHMCYRYTTTTDIDEHFACLPGRMMVTAHNDCMTNGNCSKEPSRNHVCAKAYAESGLKFMRIVVERQGPETHNVLYVGIPSDILQTVTVSELIPRLGIFSVQMPHIIQRFLQYMFSMSGALALLNIVPCYALDGQWAFKAFLDCLSGNLSLSEDIKHKISSVILTFGTLLLVLNVIFGFIHMFIK